MSASILSVTDLGKRFGSMVAARDISVSVPAHQTVGVIGSNAPAKTTFINMITGHLRPTKGTIHFEGHDITGLPSPPDHSNGRLAIVSGRTIFLRSPYSRICAPRPAICRAPKNFLGHVRTPFPLPGVRRRGRSIARTVPDRALPKCAGGHHCRRACAAA